MIGNPEENTVYVGDDVRRTETVDVAALIVGVVGLDEDGELDWRDTLPHALAVDDLSAVESGVDVYEPTFRFEPGDILAKVCAREVLRFTTVSGYVMHTLGRHSHQRYLLGARTTEFTELVAEGTYLERPRQNIMMAVQPKIAGISLAVLESVGLAYLHRQS